MTNTTPTPPNRAQRVLATMIAVMVGIAVVSFLTTVIATAAGVRNFSDGVWPFIYMLAPVALVIGFSLLIALLIVTAIHRARGTKDAGH